MENIKTDRQSNAELVRIIAMLMIVIHHFSYHCLYPNTKCLGASMDWDELLIQFGHCFVFIGVNLFILVSGFFGIKTKVKGFLRLYSFIFFYTFLKYLIKVIFHLYQNDLQVDALYSFLYLYYFHYLL